MHYAATVTSSLTHGNFQVAYIYANLLQTCYGLATGKLVLCILGLITFTSDDANMTPRPISPIHSAETKCWNYIHLYSSEKLIAQKKKKKTMTIRTRKAAKHIGLLYYRVRQIKLIPCRVLLISQQRIRIFTRKFTRLFIIHIYV